MQNLYEIILFILFFMYFSYNNFWRIIAQIALQITKIKECLKNFKLQFLSTNSIVMNTFYIFFSLLISFNLILYFFFNFSKICELIGQLIFCVPIILIRFLLNTKNVQENEDSEIHEKDYLIFFFDTTNIDKVFNNIVVFFIEKPLLDIFFLQYLCIFGPLVASIYSGIFGRFLNKFYVIRTTIFYLFTSFIIALDYFYNFEMYNLIFGDQNLFLTATMFNWFQYGAEISFYLLFDHLSVLMLIVVLFVSFLVHIYSIDYMAEDPHFFRFFSYLSAFTFFMIFMVVSSNFVQFFIGWEGIGVFSMLLVNFWYTRIQANKAALKAVLVNRVGDIFLLFAMGFSLYFFDTLNFDVLRIFFEEESNLTYLYKNYEFLYKTTDLFRFFALSLLIASMVKSAQIGFYIWLPDAMEGPTPVSALLHAATMVTAGVYLLLRFSFIFEMYGDLLFILGIFSMFTSLFAGLVALYQYDIKKIIAYSTCSQLALMFVAISFSKYAIAFFHLFTHAWFKALLFLTAGVIIHALRGEQDLRRMGGLLKILPFSALSLFFGTLAIIGFPMLSGFYSKETILFFMLTNGNQNFFSESTLLFVFFLFTSLLTALYSFRLFFLTFFRKPNGFKYYYFHIHNAGNATLFSLGILCILTLFCGYFFSDIFLGYGSTYGDQVFSSLYLNEQQILFEFFPSFLKRFLFLSNLFLFLIFFQVFNGVLEYQKQFSIFFFFSRFFFTFSQFFQSQKIKLYQNWRANWKKQDFWLNFLCSFSAFVYLFAEFSTDKYYIKISNDSVKHLQKNDCICVDCVFKKDNVPVFLPIFNKPQTVYSWYNGFLLNNMLNKFLYLIIEKGHFVFSIVLERLYMTYYVYHFSFFRFIRNLNIFLKKYLNLQRIYLFFFLFFYLILFVVYLNYGFNASFYFLDILQDINV